MWGGIGVLAVALLGAAGCLTNDAHLKKPPKQPEVYAVPPEDPRYDKPIEYPKETMDRDPLQQKSKNDQGPGQPGGPNRFRAGGGNGMGGP
jgi:hypothetical protein